MRNLNRNFNSISPSAKSLLLLKGHTDIPYARRAAEMISGPGKFTPDFSKKDMPFWARVSHFEYRYWTIDQLMADLEIKNQLEISSGFSFRGLDLAARKNCQYIDTDLQEIITVKTRLAAGLMTDIKGMKGKFELKALNALEESELRNTVNLFPPGEIVIVNEGLMMYLDENEKEKLCRNIHHMLKERGGYWITGDIYIRNPGEKFDFNLDQKTRAFFEKHRIREKNFDSFETAKNFFHHAGFTIDREASLDRLNLSSMKYFLRDVTPEDLAKIRKAGKLHASWRLRAI